MAQHAPSEAQELKEELTRPSSVVVHQGRLVVFTPSGSAGQLVELLRGRNLRAGLAGPVSAVGDLTVTYAEAVETLAAIVTLGYRHRVATASDLGLFRVLLSHAGRRALETAFRSQLGALAAEEERGGVALLRTVRVFLDVGRRPGAAAKELGVHVNTVYQRLAVVDRLLGDDWREPPRALELQVLLRLRDVSDA